MDRAAGDPDARRQLLNEARAAAALNHPNIAAIYDVVETDDSAHIVMEYVPGQTLSDRLLSGPLDAETVVDVALQLADALVAAHSRGVVHRDLKPGNVMITPEGRIKVLDFGLAKALGMASGDGESSASLDTSGGRRIVGTPPYVSPEHLLGNRADERSDIYGFGVLMFELLTGRRPFEGKTPTALAMAILTERTPACREVEASVPPLLDSIVARAMARDPSERYPSVAALKADLGRMSFSRRSGSTRSVRRPSGEFSIGATERRRRQVRTWVSLAACGVALAAVGAQRLSRKAGDPPATPAPIPVVAVLPLSNTSGDESNDYLGTGISDVLIVSLSRVPGVSVVSRSATLPYRGGKSDLKKAARDLGASYVIEGAVQRVQDRVRVTLSLVEAASDVVAWSNLFDGGLSEILGLQGQVADAVAAAMKVRLSSSDRRRIESPPTTNVEAFAEYARGRELLDRPDVAGNVDRAITLFEEALRKDPRFALAHAGAGKAYWAKYLETKNPAWPARARDATTEALRLDPDQPAVRYALALILRGTGRVAEAIDELRRIVAAYPAADEAQCLLGKLLADGGDRSEGLRYVRAAIALRPGYWGHHQDLGVLHFQGGSFREAGAEFRRVTELQPDNAWGYQMLGTTQHALGDTAAALESYRRAIALGHARAYSNYGSLLYASGRFEEAVKAYEEAIKIEPGSPAKHRNLGDAQRRLGREAQARESYRRALKLAEDLLRTNAKDAPTLAAVAVYEAKLGRNDVAERHAREAIGLSPGSADVLYRHAVVLALAGRDRDALEALELSIVKGYSAAFAKDDDDLGHIRETPRFQALLSPKDSTTSKGGSK